MHRQYVSSHRVLPLSHIKQSGGKEAEVDEGGCFWQDKPGLMPAESAGMGAKAKQRSLPHHTHTHAFMQCV